MLRETQMDIHDQLVIREAELIAQKLIEEELKKQGIRNAPRLMIESAALNMLIDNPGIFEQAYDKLRRN